MAKEPARTCAREPRLVELDEALAARVMETPLDAVKGMVRTPWDKVLVVSPDANLQDRAPDRGPL